MVFPFLAAHGPHGSLCGVHFHFRHLGHFARRLTFAYSQTQARPMSNYE